LEYLSGAKFARKGGTLEATASQANTREKKMGKKSSNGARYIREKGKKILSRLMEKQKKKKHQRHSRKLERKRAVKGCFRKSKGRRTCSS